MYVHPSRILSPTARAQRLGSITTPSDTPVMEAVVVSCWFRWLFISRVYRGRRGLTLDTIMIGRFSRVINKKTGGDAAY